jgi:hypothetical protein
MTKGSLLWNNIKFVSDDNLVDYYVIFNNVDKNTYYELEKTILFIDDENKKSDFIKKFNDIEIKKILKIIKNYYFWTIDKTYIE